MRLNNYILSFLLACCWGPSFLFIKMSLPTFHPFILIDLRLWIGALFLYIYIRARNVRLPPWGKLWGHCFILGAFSAAVPFSLFAFGEQTVDSVLASIINGMTPILTVIFSYFLGTEILNFDRILGVLLGLIGFCILLVPSLLAQQDIHATPQGVIMIVSAAICYAIAITYGNYVLPKKTTLGLPACQVLCAALLLLPFALLAYPDHFNIHAIHLRAIASLLGLSFLGTVLAFIIYFKILESGGGIVLAMSIYLLPVFGTILGALVLHEKINLSMFFGMGLIMLGMILVNGKFNFFSRKFYLLKPLDM